MQLPELSQKSHPPHNDGHTPNNMQCKINGGEKTPKMLHNQEEEHHRLAISEKGGKGENPQTKECVTFNSVHVRGDEQTHDLVSGQTICTSWRVGAGMVFLSTNRCPN